jgi:hypothetical protein
MWSIEHLRLELPPGYEHRAQDIAARLARELETMSVTGELRLEALKLPPLEIDPASGDSEIAWRIAKAVRAGVEAGG